MIRSIEGRITKLEEYRKPARKYVVHVSNPPTAAERAAIASASGPIVVVPHPCKAVEEWVAEYAPRIIP